MGNAVHRGVVTIVRTTLIALIISALPGAPARVDAATIDDLLQALARHGFRVLQQPPPHRGAYGQFVPDRKLLLIAPISQELGIARHVLLHEAVHAAQSCPDGTMTLLGLKRTTAPVVERRIRYLLMHHYRNGNAALEQEAFRLQSQPDAIQLLIDALDRRC